MNSLIEKKQLYLSGQLTKSDYEKQMCDINSSLFDYIDLLNDSLAQKIEITSDGVIIQMKNTNIRLHCIKNDKGIIPFAVLNMGEYEERLWNKTSELLNNPRTILDIGGNIGYFSLYFSYLFPNSKIYCFEPIPNNFSFLKKNLLLNNFSGIFPFNLGLSNVKQQMEMVFNPEGCGSSSLKDLLCNPNSYNVMCDFTTLDDFVFENQIVDIDFVKCDVEGAEKFVYEGGIKTIENFRPIIYSEMLRKWCSKFNYHPNDIIKFFADLNYECYAISLDSYDKITFVDESTVETNFIFLPSRKF